MRYPILIFLLCLVLGAQQTPAPEEPANPDERPMFSVSSSLVVVNVAVKDRNGDPIKGLRAEDFVVTEDGKAQAIGVFEFQELTFEPLPVFGDAPAAETGRAPAASAQDRFRNRRLMALYFDFSTMSPPDEIRAVDSATKFVRENMTASDLMAVYMYSVDLDEVQPFTDNRAQLLQAISSLRARNQQAAAEAAAATADAEMEAFNNDRKLTALRDLMRDLGRYPEKKTVIYLSSGINSNGLDNRSQLRTTTNAAVRANVTIYPIDARGLIASAPGGGGSGGGTGLFNGSAVSGNRGGVLAQQDMLNALAVDTGGKLMLDRNDISVGIVQAQREVQSYYVLGYYGSERTDGAFRAIQVSVKNRKDLRLEYRPGYYSSKLFQKFNASEKDAQLEDALRSDYPVTDIPLAVEVNYFRLTKDRYYVPVSVRVPGSAVTLVQRKGAAEAAFDFIGRVQNQRKQSATMRDTLKVSLGEDASGKLAGRSLQYDMGFQLEPGTYTLKMLARENTEGHIGTFETSFVVPNVDTTAANGLRLSSVVWSGQRERLEAAVGTVRESRKASEVNPLVSGGQKVVPSVTRTFKQGQNLYVYFELYDAAQSPSVSANVTILKDSKVMLESRGTRVNRRPETRPEAVPVLLQVPLADLPAGSYTAQLNIVDERNQRFQFDRESLTVVP